MFDGYRAMQVTTAPREDLLLMLFDGLLRFLGEMETAMREGRVADAGNAANRAQAIITQLRADLRPEINPQFTENEDAKYAAWSRAIYEALRDRDPDKIAEWVRRTIQPTRDIWQQAAMQYKQGRVGGTHA